MKRTGQIDTMGIRSGKLEDDLTPTQYRLIGQIAIAYNETEVLAQLIYGACFGASAEISDDFVSRTNGLDSTVLLSRKAISEFQWHPELHEPFGKTLDFFMEMKSYRDAVVHSRMFHVPSGIGKGSLRKGSRSEVLLTEKALSGLYERLVNLQQEFLWMLLAIIFIRMVHTALLYVPTQLDQRKRQTEPMLQAVLPQYLECQALRLSLKPLPTFPDLPEDQQGLDIKKEFSELLDSLAKGLGVSDYHNPLAKR